MCIYIYVHIYTFMYIHVRICVRVYTKRYKCLYIRDSQMLDNVGRYGVATISRLLKIIHLFYKRAL